MILYLYTSDVNKVQQPYVHLMCINTRQAAVSEASAIRFATITIATKIDMILGGHRSYILIEIHK